MSDEYIRVYPLEDETDKGYVDVHINHNGPERGANIESAIILAQAGYEVLLLPVKDEPGIKNPDAFLVEEKIVIEFKHNSTPTASAIDNEVRDAYRQSDTMLLHIASQIRSGDLLNGLKGRVRRSYRLKGVWLIWKNQLLIFSRSQILDGTIDNKIQ